MGLRQSASDVTNPDSAIMQGGDPDQLMQELQTQRAGANPDGTPIDQSQPEQNESGQGYQPPQPVFVGGRRFESQQDLDSHMIQQEARIAAAEQMVRMQPGAPQGPQQTQRDPGDILFEDPRAALQQIKQEAKSEIRNEIELEKARERSWQIFFNTYPDLNNCKDLVNATHTQLAGTIANLPLDQAMFKIASRTRQYLEQARVASGGSPSKDLSRGPAVTAGASGGRVSTPATPPAKPKDFMTQIREMQNKGKKQ
jgi:hypothetical protein